MLPGPRRSVTWAAKLYFVCSRPAQRVGVVLMFGDLYERALAGEQCFIRNADGGRSLLPVEQWLGSCRDGRCFDDVVVSLCHGPTIELGCGPGRILGRLINRGGYWAWTDHRMRCGSRGTVVCQWFTAMCSPRYRARDRGTRCC